MATPSNISSLSQQVSNLGQQNTPDLATTQKFGNAVTDLLKQYQSIEKYPFALQGINAQQQQINRVQASPTPDLVGAAPDIQSSVRSASVNAVQPTVTGAEQAGQTFASRLGTFADVLNTAQSIQAKAEASAQQAKADALNLISNSLANFGPDAFNNLDPKALASMEKMAGVPAGYIKQVSATLKAREARAAAQSSGSSESWSTTPEQAPDGSWILRSNRGNIKPAYGSGGPNPNTQPDTTSPTVGKQVTRVKAGPGWAFAIDGKPVNYLEAAQNLNLSANEAGALLYGSTNKADKQAINLAISNKAKLPTNLITTDASGNPVSGGTSQSATVPSGYKQYGLLATTDFNANLATDKLAKQYLDYYIKNATIPTAYNLGLGRNTTSAAKFTDAASRAQSLFYQATGYAIPDVNVLKGNKTLVVANNKLLNNLNLQEGTVGANFKLAVQNLEKNNINQSSPIINSWLTKIKYLMGDPNVAQYLTQNGTVQNEVGNLIAIKNATGTTVADKLASAGLVPKNASESQQKRILQILLQEAQNGVQAINSANSDLYSQIDPLETENLNPTRQSKLGGGSIFSTNQKDPLGLFK